MTETHYKVIMHNEINYNMNKKFYTQTFYKNYFCSLIPITVVMIPIQLDIVHALFEFYFYK